MRPQRKPILQRITKTLRKVDRAIARKASRAADTAVDVVNAIDKLPKKTLEAIQRAYQGLQSRSLDDADFEAGTTPYNDRLVKEPANIETTNQILESLNFDTYTAKDAADFFDKETKYWKMTEGYYLLGGDLDYFGVPRYDYEGQKEINSLAHKQIVRKHLKATLAKALPDDAEKRKQVIAFQIFAFSNPKTLVGEGKSDAQKELYRTLIESAVKNKNLLALALMSEHAGISFSEMYPREEAFDKVVSGAKDASIAAFLKDQDLTKAFPSLS